MCAQSRHSRLRAICAADSPFHHAPCPLATTASRVVFESDCLPVHLSDWHLAARLPGRAAGVLTARGSPHLLRRVGSRLARHLSARSCSLRSSSSPSAVLPCNSGCTGAGAREAEGPRGSLCAGALRRRQSGGTRMRWDGGGGVGRGTRMRAPPLAPAALCRAAQGEGLRVRWVGAAASAPACARLISQPSPVPVPPLLPHSLRRRWRGGCGTMTARP
jgi:hypothetical protein